MGIACSLVLFKGVTEKLSRLLVQIEPRVHRVLFLTIMAFQDIFVMQIGPVVESEIPVKLAFVIISSYT